MEPNTITNLIFEIDQPKTWFFDLDGTLVIHNGYKNGGDELLPGVKDFFENLPNKDVVVITTARTSEYKQSTIHFLNTNNIRFNHIIFDLPTGERVLVNDMKPDKTKTAYSINLERNKFV